MLRVVVLCRKGGKPPKKVGTLGSRECSIWAAAQIIYLNSCQSRFSGVHLVLKVFRDIWPSNKENPSIYWHATLSSPLMASSCTTSYLVPISFWSRSDADYALDFLSDLAFQACISFCSVLDKSGAWMFLACSIKNAVAHMKPDSLCLRRP